MKTEFSVIIPTYNSKETIRLLLDSLYKQTYKEFEVIVCDDNSSDGTPDIVSKYPVRLFNLGKNMGAAYARNYGAKQAQGDILAFFDADVILEENVMSKFHKRFKEEHINVLIGMYAGEPAKEGFLQEFKALQEQAWYDHIPDDEAIPFTPYAGAIRKTLFFEVGGFDEKYADADVEDYEFTIGLIRKSKIHIDKSIKVKHHFPGLKKLIKSYFRRCFMWTEIFLRQKEFQTNGTTPRQGGVYVCYSLSLVSFVVSLALGLFIYFGVIFLFLAFYLDRYFISLLWRRKGAAFMISSVFLNIFLSQIVTLGAFLGFIYYGTKKK